MKDMHPLHINVPISKIDEDQRMVWGYATVEEVDAHGEIIGYEASKKAFSNWIGNIREMHGPVAVGKSIEVTFDDENKGVWLGSYISESADGENAWIKVKEGILTAYSIGGNVTNFEMVKVDGNSHLMVTAYDLAETSLVDNPACPSATLQIVKGLNGGLRRTESIEKQIGRRPEWWESRFNFSPSQQIIKSKRFNYNRSSMKDKSSTLAKDIYSADELIDLASCLSSYIWMQAYEGEDVTDLTSALETIKQAAADKITEPSSFPEPLAVAINNACVALNITKREELKKMSDDKKALEKGNVIDGVERDSDGKEVKTPEVTINKPGDKTETTETEKGKETAEKTETAETDAEKAAKTGDLSKSTDQSDLAKTILAGVGEMIEKSVTPLKEEIERLKSTAAPSKRAASYMDVDKVEKTAKNEFETNKEKFDALMEKANDYAANPSKGTLQQRIQLGMDLRKTSRLMDPASRAQHAAIRAQFNQPGAL